MIRQRKLKRGRWYHPLFFFFFFFIKNFACYDVGTDTQGSGELSQL